MKVFRKSTAVVARLGPFVNPTDGVTPITTLISQTGRLSINGAMSDFTPTSWAHDAGGYYLVGFSIVHTGTVGPGDVSFSASESYAPVWHDLEVLSVPIYDFLYGTAGPALATEALSNLTWTDALAASLGGLSDVPTATDMEAAFAITQGMVAAVGADVVTVDTKMDAVKGKTDQLTFTNALHVDATASGGAGGDPWDTDVIGGGYTGGKAGRLLRLMAGVLAGINEKSIDGTLSTFYDVGSASSIIITSVNTLTRRDPTYHDV